MAITQTDDFKGELNLPYQSDNVSADIIQGFIDKYEPKFLRMLLGSVLCKQFVEGLDADPVEQKWLDLEELVKPALLNYIYYMVRQDGVSVTTNVGEVVSGSANSTTVSPVQKMVRAWNEMVDRCGYIRCHLYEFSNLYATERPQNISDLPLYPGMGTISCEIFRYKNRHGL